MTQLSVLALFLPLVGFFFTLILGKKIKSMYLFEIAIISAVMIIAALLAFFKLGYYTDAVFISEFTWIKIKNLPLLGEFSFNLGFKIDNISVIMLFVVAAISTLVHYYSIAYMKDDKRYNRFFAYLGIFTFSMNGIVLTHNLLMMYIFWELVGLSSYLLIGFWYEKKSASDAAKKAFLVNRIGDMGMLAGILIVFLTFHTFTFDDIFAQVSQGVIPFNSEFWLTMMGILLFCGAIGKSAQFPLHVWLPDAMEGPTPVSALIHAATMVAAGVYLTVRIFPVMTGDALLFVAVIGAISAFIPATIALTQTDIKRVLAYSTVSQLGYMIMSIGVGSVVYGFFHLVTHAFFKAGLFLGSGSVIHGMHHEQEITEMGGLRKKMPVTYVTFLIFCLAISGVPFFSGFLSKDGILAGTAVFGIFTGHWLIPVVAFSVAVLTAFYMFRLLILTFHGTPRNQHKYDHAHESPKLMIVPLIILALFSFFFVFTPNPISADTGWTLGSWIKVPHSVVPESARYSFLASSPAPGTLSNAIYTEAYTETAHHIHYSVLFGSLILAGIGILFAFLFYQYRKLNADKLAKAVAPAYKFSRNKWYFDELYDATFIAGTMWLSRALAWFDATVVDGIVNLAASVTRIFSRISGAFDNYVVDGLVNLMATLSGMLGLILRRFQTGKVQVYLVFVLFSIIVLILTFA
ncbi:MAG: NADH-quinone oxidoreductase subunit L [Ignavibacteriaceae bacterium]